MLCKTGRKRERERERDEEREREREVKREGAPGDVVGPPPRSKELS